MQLSERLIGNALLSNDPKLRDDMLNMSALLARIQLHIFCMTGSKMAGLCGGKVLDIKTAVLAEVSTIDDPENPQPAEDRIVDTLAICEDCAAILASGLKSKHAKNTELKTTSGRCFTKKMTRKKPEPDYAALGTKATTDD